MQFEGSAVFSSLKGIFRALRYRNFRLFFIGQTISLTGTWMQLIAMSWLVYRLTNSATLLGVVGFMGNLPSLLVAPFAGVLADRWNRHRMMIIIQAAAMLQAFILAILVLASVITVWQILLLSVFLGFVNAFDMPVRQSFLLDMIENKNDLGNAIALNSSMVNASRLIGPSIAGILIAATGEGVCFLINAISFLAVLIALMAMKIQPRKIRPAAEPVLRELKDGLSYAFGFAPIRAIIILLALINLVGMPYTILMPIFAKDILKGGPHTLGFLMAAVGVGALISAVYLASRKSARGLGQLIAWSCGIFGAGLVAFSFSRNFWISTVLMFITGAGMISNMAASNTVLQTIADEDKRGRVMSLYTVAFRGMAPFGSLLAGSVAGAIGAPYMLLIGGLCCVLGALLYAKKIGRLRAVCSIADVFGSNH